MPHSPLLSASLVKTEALQLGFACCGIAPAAAVAPEFAASFSAWLDEGKQGGMAYMERYRDKRMDPLLLEPDTRSIVCVALSYYPEQTLPDDSYQLSWYALGEDYHNVVKDKLHQLLQTLQQHTPGLTGRAFCDTAPVWERYWAWQSGIGWTGKHGGIVVPNAGSCFFLGELLLNLPTDCYDRPLPSRCGTCTRCIDACPTGALQPGKSLDARRCLSYLTIEQRDALPPGCGARMHPYIYGCDRCFKACPHLRRPHLPCDTRLQPSPQLLRMTRDDWHSLTEEQYRTLFKASAVKRTKYSGLVRNITAVKESDAP